MIDLLLKYLELKPTFERELYFYLIDKLLYTELHYNSSKLKFPIDRQDRSVAIILAEIEKFNNSFVSFLYDRYRLEIENGNLDLESSIALVTLGYKLFESIELDNKAKNRAIWLAHATITCCDIAKVGLETVKNSLDNPTRVLKYQKIALCLEFRTAIFILEQDPRYTDIARAYCDNAIVSPLLKEDDPIRIKAIYYQKELNLGSSK